LHFDGDVLQLFVYSHLCFLPCFCRSLPATGAVELGVHYAILQRTQQLLSQYMLLPDSWNELWEAVDAEHIGGVSSNADVVTSCSAKAVVGCIMDELDAASYDSEAQVLMLSKEDGPAMGAAAAVQPKVTGVLAEIDAMLQPFKSFFGRQHLASLHAFAGPAGQQLLLTCLLNKLDNQQVSNSQCNSKICRIMAFLTSSLATDIGARGAGPMALM
jgi:hypothetical protein